MAAVTAAAAAAELSWWRIAAGCGIERKCLVVTAQHQLGAGRRHASCKPLTQTHSCPDLCNHTSRTQWQD
jgi:hypothetical protein